MSQEVNNYFLNEFIPLIQKNYSELMKNMDIMVLGSVGLGIDDKLSDIEAAIYLNDNLWREKGKTLQLLLNECLSKTNKWKKEGSIICVHPVSWLLDGNANKFLIDMNKDDLPWENISFESLFTIQNNLIVYSSNGMLNKLRDLTDTTKYPSHLWKKRLLIEIKDLVFEDYFELTKSVSRQNYAEANIIFGKTIERIFHIGFLISHQYYPWRTHLNWAFEKLSLSSTELSAKVRLLLSTNDWIERVNLVDSIINHYKNYININNLLPEIEIMSSDLEQQLLWAERLEAWNNPNWRSYVEKRKQDAIDNGYDPSEFWVWSLWK